MRVLTLIGLVLLIGACNSKLTRNLTDNKPHGFGFEEEFDVSVLNFTDVQSGAEVNVADFFETEELDYLLLIFGSRGCISCNEKAGLLRDFYLAEHPLFNDPAYKNFRMIGVNVDPPDTAGLSGYLAKYSFMKWLDEPSLESSMLKLLPLGSPRKVPFTVLLNRRGIVFRLLADDAASIEDILQKTEKSLGGDAKPVVTPAPTQKPEPVAQGALSLINTDRFRGVEVKDCQDRKNSLQGVLPKSDYRFVHVARQCGADCVANQAALQELMGQCDGLGVSCSYVNLVTDQVNNRATKCTTFSGGAEFFDVFASVFDWRYELIFGDEGIQIPNVEGPLLLTFNLQGELVYAREGVFSSADVATDMAAADFAEMIDGPSFPLYSKPAGHQNFADVSKQSEYTVVATWGAYPFECDSCMQELKHWSEPDQLVDFCAKDQSFCQILGLETYQLPTYEGFTLSSYFDAILYGKSGVSEGLLPRSVRVPLYLDPVGANDDSGNHDFDRFFQGYLANLKPEWFGAFRTAIYDREGKILAMFQAVPPEGKDPVLEFLKERQSSK